MLKSLFLRLHSENCKSVRTTVLGSLSVGTGLQRPVYGTNEKVAGDNSCSFWFFSGLLFLRTVFTSKLRATCYSSTIDVWYQGQFLFLVIFKRLATCWKKLFFARKFQGVQCFKMTGSCSQFTQQNRVRISGYTYNHTLEWHLILIEHPLQPNCSDHRYFVQLFLYLQPMFSSYHQLFTCYV